MTLVKGKLIFRSSLRCAVRSVPLETYQKRLEGLANDYARESSLKGNVKACACVLERPIGHLGPDSGASALVWY